MKKHNLVKLLNFRSRILKVNGVGRGESKFKISSSSGLKITKYMQHREMLCTFYDLIKCIGVFGLSPSAARNKGSRSSAWRFYNKNDVFLEVF